MRTSTVTSRDNPLLRRARATRDGKIDELVFIEGMRLADEAILSNLKIEVAIISDQLATKERIKPLLDRVASAVPRITLVSEKLLESISYTKTPQGIVLLACRPDSNRRRFQSAQTEAPLIVIMQRLNNPANVGAILRTAEAAGATGAIATKNTSDPLSPKSLRGAMGSAFRLPLWFGPEYDEALNWCAARQIQTICADVESRKSYGEIDWKQPSAIIVGPESTGLTDEEIAAADHAVRIPMRGPAESLNVAVAAGVLLYEAARIRGW